MWKIVIGFVVFAAIVLFVLSRSGSVVDMSGEKHGAETPAAESASMPASAAASAP